MVNEAFGVKDEEEEGVVEQDEDEDVGLDCLDFCLLRRDEYFDAKRVVGIMMMINV